MKKRSASDTATFMAQARKRWLQSDTEDSKQIQRELDDLRFYADDQWPTDIKASRAGQNAGAGIPPTPARPCLVINKLRDPIRHVEAEAQQTDLGPEIVPADDFAGLTGAIDDTEIELREGLVRKIQRDSAARDARNWAASRARIAGRGYYVVMTRFVSSRTNDQEVTIDRLYNQNGVRLDPAHEQPDGSDAEWGFYGTTMSWDAYKAEYPGRPSVDHATSDDDEWRGLGDDAPDWFTEDGENRSVRVVNYFYTTRTSLSLIELADGRCVEAAQLPEGAPLALDPETGEPLEPRQAVKKSIHWAKIDGAQVLDETDWPSPYLPIVKVVGEELQPFDKERRYQGMVRPARDSQVGFNVMATTEVEIALLLPKSPVVGYSGQFEGHEPAWDAANTRNIGRLEVNAKTDQTPAGAILPLPQPIQRNSDVGTFDSLRGMFDQAIRSTTGTPDSTLGNVDPGVRSGRAVKALIESAKQGTSGYLANLVKSVTYEAKIINSLLYPIYGRRKGRLLQMMTGKHESQGVMVGQPFVRSADGRPEAFDPQKHQGQTPQEYTLSPDAECNVAIRVSKDYDTRRQEEASMLSELVQAAPQLLNVVGDLLFENEDGPGHKEIADRMKLVLLPPIQQQMSGQQPLPPHVQAGIQQLQQQNQQLQQALQEAHGVIQTKQVEQQGKLQVTQAQESAELERNRRDNETKLAVAELGAKVDRMQLFLDERARLGTQQHDAGQAMHDRAHDVGMAAMGQQHAIANADQAAANQQVMAAQQPQGGA